MCLDPRSLPSGAGIGEVRKAAMRWIDLLADLGLGLWRVPVLADRDAENVLSELNAPNVLVDFKTEIQDVKNVEDVEDVENVEDAEDV